MKFGCDVRNHLTGAGLSVRIFQIASLLPVLYLFAAAGYPALYASRNVLSVLFDLGVSCLPRIEALGLSWVYRHTASELLSIYSMPAIALVVGILAKRLRARRTARVVYAVWLGLDLALRLIELRTGADFSLPVTIIAFVLRAACLTLVVLDLKAERAR